MITVYICAEIMKKFPRLSFIVLVPLYGSEYSAVSWLKPWYFAPALFVLGLSGAATAVLAGVSSFLNLNIGPSEYLFGLSSYSFAILTVRAATVLR